jgi:5-methylcytosine-specific restriction endonuclease McrA
MSGGWQRPRSGRCSGRTWATTKARILARDHGVCHICKQPGADEVDHVIPVYAGGSDDDTNLAPAHAQPCHAAKSSAEGLEARRARGGMRRPPEAHPGLTG